MSFLDSYEPVADRIAAFWAENPKGRIHTDIVLINADEVVIKASVYTDRDDPRPAAIDFARESRTSGQLVKFAVENCSTSAIGRALATLNFQVKSKSGKAIRPSREEMTRTVSEAPKQKNWAQEATVLAGTKNIPGLRALYKEAQAAEAGDEILQSIKDLAKSLESQAK
jgi:hypothetical protein